jgi:hypothetical protein
MRDLSQGTRVMLLTRAFGRVENWRVDGDVDVDVNVESRGVVRVGCGVGCCGSDDVVEACWVIEAVDCVSADS